MGFRSRRSLAVTIPLLISVLLLAALAAMSVASYLELRRTLVDIAAGRLQQAANQMGNVLALSAAQRLAAMQHLMARADFIAYLQTRDASIEPALTQAAMTHLGPASNVAAVEVWDPAGTRIFAAGAAFAEPDRAALSQYLAEIDTPTPVVGKLRRYGDSLLYPVGARVAVDGVPIGYVVERRRIANPSQTTQTVALLSGLIGAEASIAVGNQDGSAFSDLTRPVTGVPVTQAQTGRLLAYQRPGQRSTFAWATMIRSTPWTVVIEFPRDAVLAPTERLLIRSLVIASVLLIVAAAAGWLITRRITTPLREVTEAAEAVAESRPHVHVSIDRADEIGRLADSFNTMAEKVEMARLDLELRVETRTSELRAANRELAAFSYSVSHDLRAPLRAIAGFVQILEDDHAATLDATARHHLDRVKANAQRMGRLIDDLLAFSQIGRATILRQDVDMAALAAAVAHEAVAASGRPVTLTIDPLPPCYGEPALLNQVFVNLVSNAIKFTAPVPDATIHIGATAEAGTVYFVRDNGVGFDHRFAEKLFGVFQRLHRAEDFEGTGVGLAIVHRVISRHGGRVWAEGKVGAGATFCFTLPAALKAPERSLAAAAQ